MLVHLLLELRQQTMLLVKPTCQGGVRESIEATVSVGSPQGSDGGARAEMAGVGTQDVR